MWRLYERVAELFRYHLLQEVVDVTCRKPKEVHPDVSTYEKLEEDQAERKLVAFDGEAKEAQCSVRLATAPIVENRKYQCWAKHWKACRPSEYQGDHVEKQHLNDQEEQIVPWLLEDFIALQLG